MRHFCAILRGRAVKTPRLSCSKFNVLAIITAKPGKRAELLAAFKENVPNVHAEEGCIEYVPTVDIEDGHNIQTRFGEDRFRAWLPRPTTKVALKRHVVEKWASLAALKSHAAAPHMAAYTAQTNDLIANRVIHVLSPV